LGWRQDDIDQFVNDLANSPFVNAAKIVPMGGHSHIEIDAKFPNRKEEELFERDLDISQTRFRKRQRNLNLASSNSVEDDTQFDKT
jgi:hypothetical protein